MAEAAFAPSLESALVFHFTDTALSIAPLRVTVKVMPFPSVALASATANEGLVSSFLIVPMTVPLPDSMLTPVPGSSSASAGALKVALNVSSGSNRSSWVVCTSTVWLATPLAKFNVCAGEMAV